LALGLWPRISGSINSITTMTVGSPVRAGGQRPGLETAEASDGALLVISEEAHLRQFAAQTGSSQALLGQPRCHDRPTTPGRAAHS
jgi:hypothetical protein